MKWKPVVGYEGLYEVSSCGQIRSLDRVVLHGGNPRRCRGRVLKQATDGVYKAVTLSKNGVLGGGLVHRIVLQAFVGPCPPGHWCRHLDGDSTNNDIKNLQWGTPFENAQDTKRHGKACVGERNPNATLTDEERAEIKKLRGILPIRRISELYGVWPTTIYAVFHSKERIGTVVEVGG